MVVYPDRWWYGDIYDGMVGWYAGYTTRVVYPDRWWYGGIYVFYRVDLG